MQATRTSLSQTQSLSAPPLGMILGTVSLPAIVPTMAAKMSDEFFTAAEEIDFCGDTVETHSIPAWASRESATWLPDLAALGYRRAAGGFMGREEQLVISAGCDMHTDDEGLVLMVVLHNDNLTFRQGKVRHLPKAGDWFVFDDRKPHAVIEADGRAMFIGWNIPIVLL